MSARVTPRVDGVRIAVRLTPKGGRDGIDGWRDGVLTARVAVPPEDGKANAALIALLAKSLAVPKSAIQIASGETARNKILDIKGNPGALAGMLEAFGMKT